MIDRPHDGLDPLYDFGDDADDAGETAATDPAFDAWIRRTAPAVNAPGALTGPAAFPTVPSTTEE